MTSACMTVRRSALLILIATLPAVSGVAKAFDSGGPRGAAIALPNASQVSIGITLLQKARDDTASKAFPDFSVIRKRHPLNSQVDWEGCKQNPSQ
jgi:hypothetical protein